MVILFYVQRMTPWLLVNSLISLHLTWVASLMKKKFQGERRRIGNFIWSSRKLCTFAIYSFHSYSQMLHKLVFWKMNLFICFAECLSCSYFLHDFRTSPKMSCYKKFVLTVCVKCLHWLSSWTLIDACFGEQTNEIYALVDIHLTWRNIVQFRVKIQTSDKEGKRKTVPLAKPVFEVLMILFC